MCWPMKLKYFLLLILLVALVLVFPFIYFMIEEVEEYESPTYQDVQTEEGPPPQVDDNFFDEYQEIDYTNINDRLVQLDDGVLHDFPVDRVVAPTQNALQHAERLQLPVIIWWNGFGTDHDRIKRASMGDCYFTKNQSFYHHPLTKAFLFYGTDFNISDIPIPRKAHHEWGLLHEESPKNEGIFLYEDTLKLFNHTATFRTESNYPLSTEFVISASYLLSPPKYTVVEKNVIKMEEKLASVVYIQSGCHPPSDRDAYINELMKYVAIDSYGKCLHNKDLPEQYRNPLTMFNKGFIDILQKYKFVISFENAICKDYITEKLYRTLFIGAIPIYKGAPNVKDWLPNKYSAIVVDDFKSVKDLADYINLVDTNPTEYEKYMEYKRTGISSSLLRDTLQKRQWGVDTPYKMSFVTGFECHVCDQIHKNKKLTSAGQTPIKHQATFEHYGCPPPTKYDLPSPPGTGNWERESWVWEYEEAGRRLENLKKSLQRGSVSS